MWITPEARPLIASISIVCVLVFAGCSNISDGPVAEAKTASVAPAPEVTEELTNVVELGDDHLTFEIPQSWNAEFEDLTSAIEADDTAPEFNGHSAQRAVITNPNATVHVDVFTNVPWPDTVAVDPDEVELLYAAPLDMGYEPSDDGYGMWLRVVIAENPALTNSRPTFGAYNGRFEDDRYMLIVAPYFAKGDLGPPDEIGWGLTAFRFPFTEYSAGAWWEESITIAAGTIRQSAAEELTGAEGLDAMREVGETEEFEQLFDVIKSFRVHVDTGAPQY